MNELCKNPYALMILEFILNRFSETEQELLELETELRTENRFFPNSKIIEKIDGIMDVACKVLDVGTIFYRSRLINKEKERDVFNALERDVCVEIKKHYPNFDVQKWETEIFRLAIEKMQENDENIFLLRELEQIQKKYSEKNFWGYDKTGSDVPPIAMSKAGRINPEGIRYLYASDNIKTAILEVRPITYQFVSVAEVIASKPIKLFDFTKNYDIDNLENNAGKSIDCTAISTYFSQPNYSGESYYLATQYISEYIKNIKDMNGGNRFDGICFRSSLNPEGLNYVLFNTSDKRKYDIINSSVFQVQDLSGNSKQVLPVVGR